MLLTDSKSNTSRLSTEDNKENLRNKLAFENMFTFVQVSSVKWNYPPCCTQLDEKGSMNCYNKTFDKGIFRRNAPTSRNGNITHTQQ